MVIRHKIMLFSIFFNSPNQNFQQCTNVRRAQVYTSAFALNSINFEIILIVIFTIIFIN